MLGKLLLVLLGMVLVLAAVGGVVFWMGARTPFYSGRHWHHHAPPGGGSVRINTLLNAAGAERWREGEVVVVVKDGPRFFVDGPLEFSSPDWTIQGQGIVTEQRVEGGQTILRFVVVWRYPWWVRAIQSHVNSMGQARGQAWALREHPEMLTAPR